MNLRRALLWILPSRLRSKLLRKSGFRERYALDMAENKELCAELLEMMRIDQEVRQETSYIFENWQNPQAHARIRDIMIRNLQIDEKNRTRLKQIVQEYGFPGNKLVGVMGTQAAWLIAQHSDYDTAFQKEYLMLLEKVVAEKDADMRHLAYLSDRVRVNEGLPQIYGTQYQGDGKPALIEDEPNVEKRRKAAGLESMSEYAKMMQKSSNVKMPSQQEYIKFMEKMADEMPPEYATKFREGVEELRKRKW
jgi:hypothetical protein